MAKQMDFLQVDMFSDTIELPPAPPRQQKSPPKIEQAPEPVFVAEKPLPASLQPTLMSLPELELEEHHEISIEDDIVSHEEEKQAQEALEKTPGAFKNIGEAAKSLDVPQHVLRFWESRFAQIKPLKMAGGRRYYRPADMEILSTIKNLLYKQGYTINGAKKVFSSRKKSVVAESADVLSQPITAFPVVGKPVLSKKQIKQLTGIREELVDLQKTLSQLLH